jgi:hypothetical protein
MMNWRVIVMGIYFRGPMRIWCPTKDGQERGLARATKTATCRLPNDSQFWQMYLPATNAGWGPR